MALSQRQWEEKEGDERKRKRQNETARGVICGHQQEGEGVERRKPKILDIRIWKEQETHIDTSEN